MKKTWFIMAMVLGLAWSQPAAAHIFWLLAEPYTPEVGKPVQVEIGFGHKFPKDEEIKAERLQFVKVLGPDGKEVPLKQQAPTHYEFTPATAGTYVVVSQLVPGFVTRTPQGMKMQTKKGVPDANLCFRFDFAAKTLVRAGGQPQGFDQSAQSSLEVMPLTPLAVLKTGDNLPVKVIFQGKPLAEAEIRVTHEHQSDPHNPQSIKGKTDAQGEFRLNLDKPGRWLIIAAHKTPYHDLEECDENMYQGSLAFVVK